MGPRVGLEEYGEEKITCSHRGSRPEPCSPYAVAVPATSMDYRGNKGHMLTVIADLILDLWDADVKHCFVQTFQ